MRFELLSRLLVVACARTAVAWPSVYQDLKDVLIGRAPVPQRVPTSTASAAAGGPTWVPGFLGVSPYGNCGYAAGYTCLGSGFGDCCGGNGLCTSTSTCQDPQCNWGTCPNTVAYPTTTSEASPSSTCLVSMSVPSFCGTIPPFYSAKTCRQAANSCFEQAYNCVDSLVAAEQAEEEVDYNADAECASYANSCDVLLSFCQRLAGVNG